MYYLIVINCARLVHYSCFLLTVTHNTIILAWKILYFICITRSAFIVKQILQKIIMVSNCYLFLQKYILLPYSLSENDQGIAKHIQYDLSCSRATILHTIAYVMCHDSKIMQTFLLMFLLGNELLVPYHVSRFESSA